MRQITKISETLKTFLLLCPKCWWFCVKIRLIYSNRVNSTHVSTLRICRHVSRSSMAREPQRVVDILRRPRCPLKLVNLRYSILAVKRHQEWGMGHHIGIPTILEHGVVCLLQVMVQEDRWICKVSVIRVKIIRLTNIYFDFSWTSSLGLVCYKT